MLAVIVIGVLAKAAWADPPANIDARMEAVRAEAETPGMALAIVENGETTHARGYGTRRLGNDGRVTADTIFPIASTGKAFTVAALATLVDPGRIGWDDKVIDHLPWFQMHDPWVTREMTIRDLLVHRSGLGLGAGDLLFVPRSSLSREETVRRLRYIRPATSFRSGYAYDNLLYIVAGQLIEEVTGETWEAYVRDVVLGPAGMENSTTDDAARFRTEDRAHPHARIDGRLRGLGEIEPLDERAVLGRNAAPAGGIATSAHDIARWLEIQLARGALPDTGGRLFSEEASREMWTPVVLQPIEPLPEPVAAATPNFDTYALGWEVRDYRGHKIVWHSGADIGFGAIVALIPERDTGFAILANSEDGVPVVGMMYELLDHYLGLPPADWPARWETFRDTRTAEALALLEAEAATPAGAGPSLPLAGYVGDYADPWYGPIGIEMREGQLVIDFKQTPNMAGVLEHWRYDTFRARWDDPVIEPAYVTFALNSEGAVERITMRAVSPLADFSYDYHDLLLTPVTDEAAAE